MHIFSRIHYKEPPNHIKIIPIIPMLMFDFPGQTSKYSYYAGRVTG